MAGREDIFEQSNDEGYSAAWEQDWSRAAAAFSRALVEFPENLGAIKCYGFAQDQLQKYELALKAYFRAARLSPDDSNIFENITAINEKMGNTREALQAVLHAAEINLKHQDIEKGLKNLTTAARLDPQNLQAHSRLAMIYEKAGQTCKASAEFAIVADILQNNGNPKKALDVLQHALLADPDCTELLAAKRSINSGQAMAPSDDDAGADPISAAHQQALMYMAGACAGLVDEDMSRPVVAGSASLLKITVTPSLQPDQAANPKTNTLLVQHLKAALQFLGWNVKSSIPDDVAAINELQQCIADGLVREALYFELGRLQAKTEQPEAALSNLQHCCQHTDYSMPAHLLSGRVLKDLKQDKSAAMAYLEALKNADVSVVNGTQSEGILQLYEYLLETIGLEKEQSVHQKVSQSVEDMLLRPSWQKHLEQLRSTLPTVDGLALPVAELFMPAQARRVIDAIKAINKLADADYLRSATDETFHTLLSTPNYLPLHLLIAELLQREGQFDEAIVKLSTIANTYIARGDTTQAIKVLRQVLKLTPMDMLTRNRLITELLMGGRVDDAIREYYNLADINYRLAELDLARQAYASAVELAQQNQSDPQTIIKLLAHMVDIDMQRLDWSSAILVFEQINKLNPDDFSVWKNLIDLNMRLGRMPRAEAGVRAFATHLAHNRPEFRIPFIKKIVEEHPEEIIFSRILAEQLFQAGQTWEAINVLDLLGDKLLEKNDHTTLVEVVHQILSMDPPNAAEYRDLLLRI